MVAGPSQVQPQRDQPGRTRPTGRDAASHCAAQKPAQQPTQEPGRPRRASQSKHKLSIYQDTEDTARLRAAYRLVFAQGKDR